VLGRLAISKATIESWRRRPIVGHGTGSINQLSATFRDGARIEKVWNGNFVLFVLHDSGLAGLAALLGLGVVVCRRAGRAIGSAANGAGSSVAVPALAAGAALCLCYLFLTASGSCTPTSTGPPHRRHGPGQRRHVTGVQQSRATRKMLPGVETRRRQAGVTATRCGSTA